jgi:hypothetical protein
MATVPTPKRHIGTVRYTSTVVTSLASAATAATRVVSAPSHIGHVLSVTSVPTNRCRVNPVGAAADMANYRFSSLK